MLGGNAFEDPPLGISKTDFSRELGTPLGEKSRQLRDLLNSSKRYIPLICMHENSTLTIDDNINY